jgi:hypothetical protein
MGCTSSRLASQASHRPRSGPSHEQPQMSHCHIPLPPPKHPKHAEAYYAFVNKPPKPPPHVARGRTANKHAPRAYDPYDSPYSRMHYSNGKSQNQAHNQYKRKHVANRITMRDVSPPRHMNELPRGNASYAYRDVSPLGTSRFERPFERPARTYAVKGRGRVAAGATFRDGGIGGWENW